MSSVLGYTCLSICLVLMSHEDAWFLIAFRVGSCPFCPFLAADIFLGALRSRSHQTSSFESPCQPPQLYCSSVLRSETSTFVLHCSPTGSEADPTAISPATC